MDKLRILEIGGQVGNFILQAKYVRLMDMILAVINLSSWKENLEKFNLDRDTNPWSLR